jgi:hypothetical protein
VDPAEVSALHVLIKIGPFGRAADAGRMLLRLPLVPAVRAARIKQD